MATLLLASAVTPLSAGALPDAALDALFARAAQSDAMLRLLLQSFPKGADLHRHAEGALYAEDMLAWGAEKDGCLLGEPGTHSMGPCTDEQQRRLKDIPADADVYTEAIDAMSMGRHGHVPQPRVSGHEQFFATFSRFGFAVRGDRARIIAANRETAALDNILYLELMAGPRVERDVRQLIPDEPWNEADMEGRFKRLQPFLKAAVPAARKATDEDDRLVDEFNGCKGAKSPPACQVTLRYLTGMSRLSPPEQVFTSMALGFALVQADPRYVGINIFSPEDGHVSLRDYSLHMRMFAFFKEKYPEVQLSLHAGELSLGLVPPRDLTFHIREAVEIAGARRIGHGVDIAFEHDAAGLLKQMAEKRIAVEINLTSNDVILGVTGPGHPLPLYLAAGVPVVLSSDDPGVARADLTYEYIRAVKEHGLSYTTLRQISRNSITYSFLPGESIWEEDGTTRRKACDGPLDSPGKACSKLLESSAKAREQWRLEQALARYEAGLPAVIAAVPLVQ